MINMNMMGGMMGSQDGMGMAGDGMGMGMPGMGMGMGMGMNMARHGRRRI